MSRKGPYPKNQSNKLHGLFQRHYCARTTKKRQKLINFCLEKARILNFPDYVTDADINEIRCHWTKEEVELVCNKITETSDAMFCPWCRYGYNVKGHHYYIKRCGECTYGKRHGQCGYSDRSDYGRYIHEHFGANIKGNFMIMLNNHQIEYLLNILK